MNDDLVVVFGAQTSLGEALVRALRTAEFCVTEPGTLGARVPNESRLVLYCHDAAADSARHISELDTLCSELAHSRPATRQLRLCLFTPANACADSTSRLTERAVLQPRCLRDLTYAQAELILHAWCGLSRTTILPQIFRHGELYCDPDAARPLFGHVNTCLRRAQHHENILFPGLGIQRRTLTHLDDFAAAVVAFLRLEFAPSIINLPGETLTIADYLHAICNHYGLEAHLTNKHFDDDLPWGLADRVLSTMLFKAELPGFRLRHHFKSWLEQLPVKMPVN